MDIIAIVEKYIEEIFAAAEEFQEKEAGLGKLEERLEKASHESVREVLGEILNDTDRFLEKARHREEFYTVQRHDQRTLISSLGDVRFRHTLYRSRKDGSYHYLLDERLHLPKDEHFTEMAEVKMLEEAAQSGNSKRRDPEGIESGGDEQDPQAGGGTAGRRGEGKEKDPLPVCRGRRGSYPPSEGRKRDKGKRYHREADLCT